MKHFLLPILFVFMAFAYVNGQQIWENFQDIRKGEYFFENGTFIPYFENPDQNGNTSLVAGQYSRNPAELFDVITIDGAMADLSDYLSGAKSLSIDVWSPAVGKTVQITLENRDLALPANFPTGRHSVYLATTSVANAWETLTFSFDNQPDASVANDNVNRLVLLFDPNSNNGDTYYWDNLNGPELADDPCDGVSVNDQIINDFECQQNISYTFSHSGPNFRRVANPDQAGNPSSFVASYTRNGGEMDDVIIGRLNNPITLGSGSIYTLDVWDPNAPTTVAISFQSGGVAVIDTVASTSASNQWQTLTFDVREAAGSQVDQIVTLFDPGNFTSDNYFFDNFRVSESVNVAEVSKLNRLEVFPNPVSNGSLVYFEYELEQSATVQLNVFDLNGKLVSNVINADQSAGNERFEWNTTGLSAGLYFYNLIIDGQSTSGKITVR